MPPPGDAIRGRVSHRGAVGAGSKITVVSSSAKTSLLRAGHEAEWARINRAEAQQERAINMKMTPAQRVKAGQKLSQQAVALLAASIRAGHAPRRAYWS